MRKVSAVLSKLLHSPGSPVLSPMRLRNFFVLLFLSISIITAGILFTLYSPHSNRSEDPVSIPHGASLTSIARILEDNDIISNRTLFSIATIISGKNKKLQSGVYQFPRNVSINEVIIILTEGTHQVEFFVTFPEGTTVKGIASILARKAGKDSNIVIALSRDKEFLRSLEIKAYSLEGYLLPETYRIRPTDTEEKILRRMVGQLRSILKKKYLQRMKKMGYSFHEILTIASLTEGETGLPHERARVAGVYHNRLKRGMLLQADPTIQYIIRDSPRRLLYEDLRIDSPYNTYKYKGLPPGPVNNPGKDAIIAALYPESHKYLYFVADGKGGHKFSVSEQEHSQAVSEYRKYQRGLNR